MIERKYVPIADVATEFGIEAEALRQTLIQRNIPLFVELDECITIQAGRTDEAVENAQTFGLGEDEGLQWHAAILGPTPDRLQPMDVFVLSGWARLEKDSANKILRKSNGATLFEPRFEVVIQETQKKLLVKPYINENLELGEEIVAKITFPNCISAEDLRARRGDIKSLFSTHHANDKGDTDQPKPDWGFWQNMDLTWLDNVIVLACDIDPIWHGNRDNIDTVRKLKGIAESHVKSGRLVVKQPEANTRPPGDHGEYLISLFEFRRWGESLATPIVFPEKYPQALPASKGPIDQGSNIPTQKSRNSYLRLIDALSVMAKIPDRGFATAIEAQLQQLGYDSPNDDTIREIVKDARAKRPV